MKRFTPMLLATGIAIGLAGCTPATVSQPTGAAGNTSQAASSEFTLVTLKVPNMT